MPASSLCRHALYLVLCGQLDAYNLVEASWNDPLCEAGQCRTAVHAFFDLVLPVVLMVCCGGGSDMQCCFL
jgi:hypothetical protein